MNQRLSMVTSVIDSVATITEGSTFSLLPSDLESTNEVVEGLIDLLEETLTSDNDTDEATLVRRWRGEWLIYRLEWWEGRHLGLNELTK